MLCIASAGELLSVAATAFTLSWTHSVEHTEWREHWLVAGEALQLATAEVAGPGAGIHLPEGARSTGSGWVYESDLPPQRRLVLAASGTTGAGWTLCTDTGCQVLGEAAGSPVEIWAAPMCGGVAASP